MNLIQGAGQRHKSLARLDTHLCAVDEVDAADLALLAENRRARARAGVSVGNALIRDALRLIEGDEAPGDFSDQYRAMLANQETLKKLAG
jgi:hypothetical protein